jgi:hypothetical protein
MAAAGQPRLGRALGGDCGLAMASTPIGKHVWRPRRRPRSTTATPAL